jgi:ATP-dependent DNA helicase RecQ
MNIAAAKDVLKTYYGYDEFRPMQEEIIQAVYDQKDVVVLMPTGGGKSICFQIPAVTMPGTCLVISPLIALMKDQVEGLKSNGISAAFMNSSLGGMEMMAVQNDLARGKIDLLYVSPEKAVTHDFITFMKNIKVNMIAIDEAHCISSWGHDFRPEYTKLKFLRQQFTTAPIIALTATADRLTRKDIEDQLGLKEPERFTASFDRPNLSLTVLPGRNRMEQIVSFVKGKPNQSGIIYCLSRKSTEKLAASLNKNGIKAAHYHAGLPSQTRSDVQEDFINDNIPIICATIAFGMGIDKSNVRWVIHYNLPKNLEGYYQEIGRAGRDGAKADTLLFYSYADVSMLRDILTKNESQNEGLQLAKLERMQQYADSLICRRKILLNYFSENTDGNCGNCDICKNPPQHFDGTVLAQKALSAVYRTREKVGMTMLIDILRGSKRKDLVQRNFHLIKTYGAGSQYSTYDWQAFLQQLLNIGLMEVAYDNHNLLRLTEGAEEVLFKGRKVELVKMTAIMEHRAKKKEKPKKTKNERTRDELFERLRQLRKQMAQKKGIPPYLIFSDRSLEEMAAAKPTTREDFLGISGVGDKKLQDYGKQFLGEIQNYIVEQNGQGIKIKGSTQLVSFHFYKQGMHPDEIAEERGLHPTTVYSHLAALYEKGEDVDILQYIPNRDLELIKGLKEDNPKITPKEIFDMNEGNLEYFVIRLTMSWLKKN